MYQWVESINSSSTLEPSPMLLNNGEGAVIQTGFVFIQEFSHTGAGDSSPILVQRRFGSDTAYAGSFSAVDHGQHWTVLRSSGMVQCLLKGNPENLFHLSNCRMVKVNNPKEMREGATYSIHIDTSETVLVLKAALPTEHSDWVLSIERTLQKLDRAKMIEGHRKRESGYVALKRLLMNGTGSSMGQTSPFSSPLYCLPKMSDEMEDIYNAPKSPLPKSVNGQRGRRSKLLQKSASLPGSEPVVQEQNEGEEETETEDKQAPPSPPPRDNGPHHFLHAEKSSLHLFPPRGLLIPFLHAVLVPALLAWGVVRIQM